MDHTAWPPKHHVFISFPLFHFQIKVGVFFQNILPKQNLFSTFRVLKFPKFHFAVKPLADPLEFWTLLRYFYGR